MGLCASAQIVSVFIFHSEWFEHMQMREYKFMYHHLVSAVTDALSIYLWFGFFFFCLLTSGRHSQEKALSGKLILCFFFLGLPWWLRW